MNLKIILPLLFTFLIIPFVFYFTKSTVFLRTSQSTKEYASHEVNSGFKGDYNREVNNVLPPYEDMKISIVIPAHNEERRIERTLRTYYSFFQHKKQEQGLSCELVVVLNGCTDNTIGIVEEIRKEMQGNMVIIDIPEAGKGHAIKTGFADALIRNNNVIGFVDADMATEPEAYYDLIQQIYDCDGVIASRYMPGANIYPERPLWKRWGSRIFYEPFVRLFFGLSYYDLQCGAKVFKRSVIEAVTPQLTVQQWAFDVELLYLCKKYGFTIKEVPTVWRDQADSKLTLFAGLRMLGALFSVWSRHLFKD